MKYFIRALKYYLYLCLILVLVIAIIFLLKLNGESTLKGLFVNGYDSLWQMALILLVFAASYPRFGYGKRHIIFDGPAADARPTIDKCMNAAGYVLVKEDGEDMVWRKASIYARITRMLEDSVTFTRTLTGYEMEGLTREIVRLDTRLTQSLEPLDE